MLGTAFVLASIAQVNLTGDETHHVFEEGVGPVPVSIQVQRGQPVSCQLTPAKRPEFGAAPEIDKNIIKLSVFQPTS